MRHFLSTVSVVFASLLTLSWAVAQDTPKKAPNKKKEAHTAKFYRSKKGHIFVADEKTFPQKNRYFYSSDGKKLKEIYVRCAYGKIGRRRRGEDFSIPFLKKEGQLSRKKTVVTLNNTDFTEIRPLEIPREALVENRVPLYLMQLKNGKYVYVSDAKPSFILQRLKLYMGPADKLKEIPVTQVNRYMDGGTTEVFTLKGQLLVKARKYLNDPLPTPLWIDGVSKPHPKAKWHIEFHKKKGTKELPLKVLSPTHYKIVEKDGVVTLKPKKERNKQD